ncbi:NAD(P)-binding protein [Macroventuria anomochaeta]|uniref:NAD(P)-binding protein n=1 Tax=Macroventuria anomochaeta TaxID=301207 RepID=A0ACB6RMS7_9PLEO|nr:NAD(P)-binding protein [Macroventuria anomochaeta]KAF2623231.1 NAD(P)-binding protein [Macroventuria anomochaeta]
MPTLSITLSFYTSLAKSLLSVAFARLYSPQQVSKRDLTCQTAIVTGANSGIGLCIAVALAKQGATVYLACRNADRGAVAVDHIVAQCDDKSKARVICRVLDVGDLSSVRAFCQQWTKEGTKIDMLVHNAGIAALPTGSPTKAKGLDTMYTTNFLGSFLMTHLLEPQLSSTARVVMTSSTGSYSAQFIHDASLRQVAPAPGTIAQYIAKVKAMLGFEAESSAPAYALSKAQQVLFAALLQRHFDAQTSLTDGERTYRTAYAFSPGFTSTPIFGKMDVTWQTWFTNPLFAALKTTEKWVAVNTEEGAKTGVWLATWGDEVGKREQGGTFWERMTKRTSLVDRMDHKRKTDEWRTWERDAEVLWNV